MLPTDGSTMLRVGMTNPPFILDSLDEIASVLKHPAVFTYLHIPVQSGGCGVGWWWLECDVQRVYVVHVHGGVCGNMILCDTVSHLVFQTHKTHTPHTQNTHPPTHNQLHRQ